MGTSESSPTLSKHPARFFCAGVENGNECFCWKNSNEYKRLGKLDDTECDTPCEGDPAFTCGGNIALEVFKIKKLDFDPITNAPK